MRTERSPSLLFLPSVLREQALEAEDGRDLEEIFGKYIPYIQDRFEARFYLSKRFGVSPSALSDPEALAAIEALRKSLGDFLEACDAVEGTLPPVGTLTPRDLHALARWAVVRDWPCVYREAILAPERIVGSRPKTRDEIAAEYRRLRKQERVFLFKTAHVFALFLINVHQAIMEDVAPGTRMSDERALQLVRAAQMGRWAPVGSVRREERLAMLLVLAECPTTWSLEKTFCEVILPEGEVRPWNDPETNLGLRFALNEWLQRSVSVRWAWCSTERVLQYLENVVEGRLGEVYPLNMAFDPLEGASSPMSLLDAALSRGMLETAEGLLRAGCVTLDARTGCPLVAAADPPGFTYGPSGIGTPRNDATISERVCFVLGRANIQDLPALAAQKSATGKSAVEGIRSSIWIEDDEKRLFLRLLGETFD